jgi:hypothetical protein
MGRFEMATHRSNALTLVLTLYEAGLALCAMYYLAIYIHQLIPASFIPGLLSVDLFLP